MQALAIVSRELNIPVSTLYSWIRAGKIASVKNEKGERLVSRDEIGRLPRFQRHTALHTIPADDTADLKEAMRLTGWQPKTLHRKASMQLLRSSRDGAGKRIFSRSQLQEIQKSHRCARVRIQARQANWKQCACCHRQPVAPGLRMLCKNCYLKGSERSEV